MANVSFKRGLSTALSNITVEDGVFYLTTDTHRLYVGQGSNLAELNQSVTTYATWADMEENAPKQEGQFYYAIQENVLACYLPELNKWQQINPDHNDNDDTYISSLTVAPVDKSETGKLKYTIIVGQKTKHHGKAETTVTPDITGQLEISSEDLNAIASNVAVGVKTDAITGNENGFALKTTGGGADADTNIAIVGGDNVNVGRSEDGKTITIKSTDTDTTYDLLSNAGDAKVTLHGSDNADRTVSFIGAQQIEVSGTNEREISISHKDSPVTAGDYNSSIEIKDNKFTVPSFTVDAQGHITNASDVTVTLPADKDTTYSLGTAVGDAQYDAYINLTPAASSGADVTSAKFKAGANIAITGSGTEITVAHSGPGDATGNAVGNNTETALDYEGKFIIPKITKDANGHIVSAEDIELTMPKAVAIPTMNYAGTTTLTANRVTMNSSLTIGTAAAQTYAPSIGSSTLALSADGNAITVDLEWGSF